MDSTKVFRDPIYNLISFDKEEDKPLLLIIDTPEFQRLRRIRQLGLSGYTFPTAVHDRFSHSLGVAYIVGELFNNLKVPEIIENISLPDGTTCSLSKKQIKILLKLTGLLHDIGHGPFSHAFENITKVHHEDMSINIIKNENGNIYPILASIEDEALKIYSPFWIKEIINGTFQPTWVKELISSQLDADRIDYLLRDAYMCGVNYATFDIKWLFQNIELGKIKNEDNRDGLLINAKKGIHAVESFIVSRYHMYEQVYYHKTTRGFEIVVQKIFERLKKLIDDGVIDESFFIDKSLLDFINDNNNLTAFLPLDDFNLITHFNHWIKNDKDEILRELCKCFIERKPFKMFKEVKKGSLFKENDYDKIKSMFDSAEIKDNYFFEDEPLNIPYNDNYLLGKKNPENAEHIWLKQPDGKLIELAQESPIIKSLNNNELLKQRAYIHRDFYNENTKELSRKN